MVMLDGLLWTRVEVRPLWSDDGFLQWVVLERHRITGGYRTTLVDDEWPATHASKFSRGSEVADDA